MFSLSAGEGCKLCPTGALQHDAACLVAFTATTDTAAACYACLQANLAVKMLCNARDDVCLLAPLDKAVR